MWFVGLSVWYGQKPGECHKGGIPPPGSPLNNLTQLLWNTVVLKHQKMYQLKKNASAHFSGAISLDSEVIIRFLSLRTT
jgi:hypothetical protein